MYSSRSKIRWLILSLISDYVGVTFESVLCSVIEVEHISKLL